MPIQLGAVFPQTEIPPDRHSIVEWATAVGLRGYGHVLAYDHVLGVDRLAGHDSEGSYDVDSRFHEPFVLFAFLAAVVPDLGLCTSVLVLPQRQTALVAKQAAFLDLTTGGRFRLGVGAGWNADEFRGMGVPFAGRGQRIDEQIARLRALWADRSVAVGDDPAAARLGIAPRPASGTVPIWIGGESDVAFRRAGRLGDGWMPRAEGDRLTAAIRTMTAEAERVGRDPATIGLQGRIDWRGSRDGLRRSAAMWMEHGATHLAVNTMGAGLQTIGEHLTALEAADDALRDIVSH